MSPPVEVGCNATTDRNGAAASDDFVALPTVWARFHTAADNRSLPEMRRELEEVPLLQVCRYRYLGVH